MNGCRNVIVLACRRGPALTVMTCLVHLSRTLTTAVSTSDASLERAVSARSVCASKTDGPFTSHPSLNRHIDRRPETHRHFFYKQFMGDSRDALPVSQRVGAQKNSSAKFFAPLVEWRISQSAWKVAPTIFASLAAPQVWELSNRRPGIRHNAPQEGMEIPARR